jgi:pyruvate/2-oxoglutarate/acetoin dehydrogenase E1 component
MTHAFDYLDAPVARVHRQGRADALCGQPRKAGAAERADEVVEAAKAVLYA